MCTKQYISISKGDIGVESGYVKPPFFIMVNMDRSIDAQSLQSRYFQQINDIILAA